ncbi:hypothetical protein P8452_44241 [Trifolium repens]|nr:hypothetical protein P8452_44241 [Trifolium repens]
MTATQKSRSKSLTRSSSHSSTTVFFLRILLSINVLCCLSHSRISILRLHQRFVWRKKIERETKLQEKTLSLLLNLSLDDDSKIGLVAEGAIDRVVAFLLRDASSDCCALAATIITSLVVVEVNKATIGAFPGAIEALVAILRDGKGRERKEAATALYALCCFRDNRKREGREQLESYGGCVKILVHVLRNGNSRGIQYALLALTSLCCHSKEMLLDDVFFSYVE